MRGPAIPAAAEVTTVSVYFSPMSRGIRVGILATVVVLGAAGLLLTGHEVPDGQPPLTHLSAETLPTLQADFNRAANTMRMIVLLAPT